MPANRRGRGSGLGRGRRARTRGGRLQSGWDQDQEDSPQNDTDSSMQDLGDCEESTTTGENISMNSK